MVNNLLISSAGAPTQIAEYDLPIDKDRCTFDESRNRGFPSRVALI